MPRLNRADRRGSAVPAFRHRSSRLERTSIAVEPTIPIVIAAATPAYADEKSRQRPPEEQSSRRSCALSTKSHAALPANTAASDAVRPTSRRAVRRVVDDSAALLLWFGSSAAATAGIASNNSVSAAPRISIRTGAKSVPGANPCFSALVHNIRESNATPCEPHALHFALRAHETSAKCSVKHGQRAEPACVRLAHVPACECVGASPRAGRPRGGELRLQLLGASYRWSQQIPGEVDYNKWGRNSLYVASGLGGRYFSKRGSHGALAELESRLDSADRIGPSSSGDSALRARKFRTRC